MSNEAKTARRSRFVGIRVSDAEFRVLHDAADATGCTLSELVRSAVAEAWLKRKGRKGERAAQ